MVTGFCSPSWVENLHQFASPPPSLWAERTSGSICPKHIHHSCLSAATKHLEMLIAESLPSPLQAEPWGYRICSAQPPFPPHPPPTPRHGRLQTHSPGRSRGAPTAAPAPCPARGSGAMRDSRLSASPCGVRDVFGEGAPRCAFSGSPEAEPRRGEARRDRDAAAPLLCAAVTAERLHAAAFSPARSAPACVHRAEQQFFPPFFF